MSVNINCTETFKKEVRWYFKYYRQYFKNDEDLKQSFGYILQKVKSGDLQFDIATEYFKSRQFSGINPSLFKKCKVFDNGNFHLIFVVCKQCAKNISCRPTCKKHSGIILCFYDIWFS